MFTSCIRMGGALACTVLLAMPALSQDQPRAGGARAPLRDKIDRPAQPPVQPQQRTANKPVTEATTGNVDQMIAGMLALGNEEESAIGKFAAEHAQSEDVQNFAKTMAKQHGEMAKELQKWAPEATLMTHDSAADGSGAKVTGNANARNFNPLHVHQQIANRCIASMEKSLGEKKGTDFDMAYIGSQCVAHQQMIDKASVLRDYASPELQASIDKGIAAAREHLDHVHQLIDTLAKAERDGK